MLTLSNLQISGKIRDLLTSSRGESDPVFGLLLADALAVDPILS